jgi:hypothetical protein
MTTTATEGPAIVSEALQDPKWVAAMDNEYKALLHNQTWHLVPPHKGRTSLIANGFIR